MKKKLLFILLALLFIPGMKVYATPILGPSTTTVYQMQEWAETQEAAPIFIELAPMFYEIATEQGIDPAVIYTQSAKETNFMNFTGVLDASFYNPCGLKTTGGGANEDPNAHQRFTDWEEGITAMADHLSLYAGASGYPKADTPDPRHFPSIYGKAPTVEALGGKWAPSKDYGNDIVRRMNHLYSMPKESIFRLAGENRYSTSIDIANYYRRLSRNILLVNGTKPSDALTASILSAQLKAPILLIQEDSIPSTTWEKIKSMEIKNVYLLGGENSIGSNIEQFLVKEKLIVQRIAGSNRFDTAVQIAEVTSFKAAGDKQENVKPYDKAIVASGYEIADALSMSAVSAKEQMPIFLTGKDTLPVETKKQLRSVKEVFLAGGENTISTAVEEEIQSMGIQTHRIAGANRYETALAIARTFFPNSINFYMANGKIPFDALVGGALAAKYDAPILLVQPGNNPSVHAYLQEQTIRRIVLLGGENSAGKLSEYSHYK